MEFKGFQTGDALKNYVRNSRCVVLPSEWYENGPYSAMEAMAVGRPLIVSGNGGLPELVDDGVNGYIYRGGSDELAACIQKMFALDEATYEAMSQASMTRAKELFDAETYVETLEEKYNEVKRQ